MARGKGKFRLLAKGKRNRICLRNQITIKLTTSGTKDPKEAVVYPNYAIMDGKVRETTLLPDSSTKTFSNQEEVQGQPKEFKIKFSPASHEMTAPLKANIETTSKSVVQVHCIEYCLIEEPGPKEKTISYSNEPIFSGTGVLLNFDGQYVVLSALHVVQPKLAKSVREVILTTNDDDMYESVKQRFDSFSIDRTKNQTFQDYLSQDADWRQWLPCEIDSKYVKFRKDWLQEIVTSGNYTKVLDPESHLKPSPSFDLVFINLPNCTADTLSKLKLRPISLDTSSNKLSNNQRLYLIGYNSCSGYVNFSDIEYQKTFQVESKQKKVKYVEDPDNLSDLKESSGIFTYLSHFVNMKKSVSLGVCEQHGDEFLLFKATSTQGSSGGPVLDENGRLVGIAFGNLNDHESQEDPTPLDFKEDESFEIRVPDEDFQDESRNYNLAISVTHSGIQDYLQSKKAEV